MQVAQHILASIKITNLSNLILPIGAGVKLQAGQTRVVNVSFVQLMEEMIPRLNRLVAKGKVAFTVIPGGPQDVAGSADTLRSGSIAALVGTQFLLPTYAASATDDLGFVMTKSSRLTNLAIASGVAPGVGQSVTLAVFVNGVVTGLTVALTGTNLKATSAGWVDTQAGDRVSFRTVATGGSLAAAVLVAVNVL